MRIVRSPLVTTLSGKMGPYYFRKGPGPGIHIVKRHDDPAPHKTSAWLMNKEIVKRLDAHWRTMSHDARLEWDICPPRKHMSALGHFYYVNQRRMFMGFQGIDVPLDTNREWPTGGTPGFPSPPWWWPRSRAENSIFEWDQETFDYYQNLTNPYGFHTCKWVWNQDLQMWHAWLYAPYDEPWWSAGELPIKHVWMYSVDHPRYFEPYRARALCGWQEELCAEGTPLPVPVKNVQACGVDKHDNLITPNQGPIDPPCPATPSTCGPPPACWTWDHSEWGAQSTSTGVVVSPPPPPPPAPPNPCKQGTCTGTLEWLGCAIYPAMFVCVWEGWVTNAFWKLYVRICCNHWDELFWVDVSPWFRNPVSQWHLDDPPIVPNANGCPHHPTVGSITIPYIGGCPDDPGPITLTLTPDNP